MPNEMPTPTAVYAPNPYIIDSFRLLKMTLGMILAGLLIFLILKIILDLRKAHYED